MPDLIPKWNQAHRRYVDQDLADWQKQFDALNSDRPRVVRCEVKPLRDEGRAEVLAEVGSRFAFPHCGIGD